MQLPLGAASKKSSHQRGQILAELLVVIAIVGVVAGAIASLYFVSLRVTETGQKRAQATALALEGVEALRAISQTDYDAAATIDSGWLHLYCPRSGTGTVSCPGGEKNLSTAYRTVLTADNCTSSGSGSWDLCAGTETISLGNETFTRTVYLENVCRDIFGLITGVAPCGGSDKEDIATQKATVKITVTGVSDMNIATYLGRWRPTNAAGQSDWSGACPTAGPVTSFGAAIAQGTNIDRAGTPGSLKLPLSANSCGP